MNHSIYCSILCSQSQNQYNVWHHPYGSAAQLLIGRSDVAFCGNTDSQMWPTNRTRRIGFSRSGSIFSPESTGTIVSDVVKPEPGSTQTWFGSQLSHLSEWPLVHKYLQPKQEVRALTGSVITRIYTSCLVGKVWNSGFMCGVVSEHFHWGSSDPFRSDEALQWKSSVTGGSRDRRRSRQICHRRLLQSGFLWSQKQRSTLRLQMLSGCCHQLSLSAGSNLLPVVFLTKTRCTLTMWCDSYIQTESKATTKQLQWQRVRQEMR